MLTVFIGRKAPPHFGHFHNIDKALSVSQQVVVLLGSANRARSIRDPFTVEERIEMLQRVYPNQKNLHLIPLPDSMYNDHLWMKNVQERVYNISDAYNQDKISLIGHSKDSTSYYLRLFPNWGSINVSNINQINSTDLRKILFADTDWKAKEVLFKQYTTEPVIDFLREFMKGSEYANLKAEYDFVQDYKKKWINDPHPRQHNTCDAVVVQSGHILLVERDSMPGKGLLALPGGFIRDDEKAVDATMRVLLDKTRIKVPEAVLRGSITNTHYFDDPNRSTRGRTLTMAFCIELKPMELPVIKGSGNAKRALWMPFGKIDPRKMFEDHYFILNKMLGL